MQLIEERDQESFETDDSVKRQAERNENQSVSGSLNTYE